MLLLVLLFVPLVSRFIHHSQQKKRFHLYSQRLSYNLVNVKMITNIQQILQILFNFWVVINILIFLFYFFNNIQNKTFRNKTKNESYFGCLSLALSMSQSERKNSSNLILELASSVAPMDHTTEKKK